MAGEDPKRWMSLRPVRAPTEFVSRICCEYIEHSLIEIPQLLTLILFIFWANLSRVAKIICVLKIIYFRCLKIHFTTRLKHWLTQIKPSDYNLMGNMEEKRQFYVFFCKKWWYCLKFWNGLTNIVSTGSQPANS